MASEFEKCNFLVYSLSMQSGREAASGTNHGLFKAKSSSHHVHVTLWVTAPTSSCPTLSAVAEPARKCAETIFSVQCAV